MAHCSLLSFAADLGTVSGFVKFPGETPPPVMFANGSDHDCPHGIGQNHLIVKQETRGLKNALVVLDSSSRRVMPTRLQKELTTVGCRLEPRLQWVPLGASLTIATRDSAHHLLRASRGGNTYFEAEISPEAPPVRRPLVTPGLFKVNCERHPWERAWILVSPHDGVAITDAEGHFQMKNVPPGEYAIRVWHEGWLERKRAAGDRLEFFSMQDIRKVVVRPQQDSEVIFDHLTSKVTDETLH